MFLSLFRVGPETAARGHWHPWFSVSVASRKGHAWPDVTGACIANSGHLSTRVTSNKRPIWDSLRAPLLHRMVLHRVQPLLSGVLASSLSGSHLATVQNLPTAYNPIRKCPSNTQSLNTQRKPYRPRLLNSRSTSRRTCSIDIRNVSKCVY